MLLLYSEWCDTENDFVEKDDDPTGAENVESKVSLYCKIVAV